jgi:hypothetical protein
MGLGACGLVASPAFATPGQTGSVAGLTFDLGPSPVGLPASCPFANDDANFVFLSGNGVMHGSSNKNGDWGGETATGTAQFYENDGENNVLIDTGHLTIWGGGGNNAKGQSVGWVDTRLRRFLRQHSRQRPRDHQRGWEPDRKCVERAGDLLVVTQYQ